jgi:hypothetical protein
LPLSRRGIRVHGIELSRAMVRQLQAQQGGSDIGVTIGDLASVMVGAGFRLVCLLRSSRSVIPASRAMRSSSDGHT